MNRIHELCEISTEFMQRCTTWSINVLMYLFVGVGDLIKRSYHSLFYIYNIYTPEIQKSWDILEILIKLKLKKKFQIT